MVTIFHIIFFLFQYLNLVVFSNLGDPFYVILNGEKQNQKAETKAGGSEAERSRGAGEAVHPEDQSSEKGAQRSELIRKNQKRR